MLKKIGPYRVEERLGVGGMGEVYKAYDDRLDRWVAIKRIRPDKESAEDNRERFIREARATARLNHPGIVHVYDIFKDGESLCIVMEYLEGRTLDTMVMEGALKPARVLKLGYEIATGLAEAHAKGIIHRDLKVENIIINEDGNAKILDFGLAKPILSNELDPNLTSKGQLVGTSRAMSPEYVSGEEIDQRSDLFSLGVLLYETSTGHSPFKAQNTLATLKQVMVHEQTPAVEMNSEIPIELSRLIDQLLAKDPEDRPQSSQEVADTLGLLLGQLSSGDITRPASSASSVNRRTGTYDAVSSANTATATAIDFATRRRRIGTILLLLSLLAAATWYQFKYRQQPPESTDLAVRQEKDLIVVANFENTMEDPVLVDSLELAFRVGLELSQQADVLSISQAHAALQRMERPPETQIGRALGIEICNREGAKALVIGSVAKIGDIYTLSGTVVDPQDGSTEYTTSAEARSQSDLVSAIQQITQDIRKNLGESLSAIQETAPLEKVTTRNIEALKAYSLGVALTATDEVKSATPLLQQAIQLDPEFAMAHAKLGAGYLYFKPEKALEHLDKAWSHRDRLTEPEKLYVQGWLAKIRSTQEKEIGFWALMSQLYPNDYHGHFNLGMAYILGQYRYQDALVLFEKAYRSAAPRHYNRLYHRIGYCQLALGEFDNALKSFQEIEKTEMVLAQAPLATLFLASRQYAKARAVIDEDLLTSSRIEDQLSARKLMTFYWMDHGNLEQALAMAWEIDELAKEGDEPDWALGTEIISAATLEPLQRRDELRQVLTRAEHLIEELFMSSEENESILPIKSVAILSKLAARNQELEIAGRFLEEMQQHSEKTLHRVWMSYTDLVESEIYLANGQADAALAKAEEAVGRTPSTQAHETLARIQEQRGEPKKAIAHYRWILQNRGRAFVDCFEEHCEGPNIIDWNLAPYHLGRLLQQTGQPEEAKDQFQTFLEQWTDGGNLATVKDAESRLLQMNHE